MKPSENNVVPTFRYMDDIKRYLDGLEKEVDETAKLVSVQQKLLASVKKMVFPRLATASTVFDVTPTSREEQMKVVRKQKMKLDPELSKIVVPNMKKLQSQYALAEDLYAKHKAVESAETTLTLSFPNRQGPEYNATIAQIKRMKEKIADVLKTCLAFLNEVAAEHVPKQFVKYIDLIAELVNDHVIFKESQSFLYVSVDDEGNLVFTNYLLLQDVANDEGEVAPHLYISTQWRLSEEPTITVDLNHEFEVPNKLIGSGETVDSVGAAVKTISEMLELENFSSALGVVPLALQLKVDPTSIKPSMFSYRDLISKVSVDDNSISFVLRKEANSAEVATEVAAQLYKELKALLKSKAALTMKTGTEGKLRTITFFIRVVAEGGEFNAYDLEFLRDRFGLSNQALRKITNIINQGGEKESTLTPVSNNLAELTKKNQELNEKEVMHRLKNRPDPKA